MSYNTLFVGWDRPIPGREKNAIESFQSFIAYLTKQQAAGLIENFEPIMLSVHGGDLNGFVIIRGEAEKLDQMRRDEQFGEELTRANFNVSRVGAVAGYRGQALQTFLMQFGKLAGM